VLLLSTYWHFLARLSKETCNIGSLIQLAMAHLVDMQRPMGFSSDTIDCTFKPIYETSDIHGTFENVRWKL
jgi:hypothetical protein